jgi:hypothetical protein
MKTDKDKKLVASPIIMQPDKEKEVSKKDDETNKRIQDSAPEQFAELKEVNLRMEEEESEQEESDEET